MNLWGQSWHTLLPGLLVGALLCTSNMFFGLQTGWVTMGSIQSALIGYVLLQLLLKMGWVPQVTSADNVLIQTVAVSTASVPLTAGFVGIIPALAQLSWEDNPDGGPVSLDVHHQLLWALGLALFGPFIAIPLRQQVIVREQLRFPTGTATASVIGLLYGQDQQSQPPPALPAFEDVEASDPDLQQVPSIPARTGSMGQRGMERGASMAESVKWEGFEKHHLARALRALFITFGLASAYTLVGTWLPVVQKPDVLSWIGWSSPAKWGWVLNFQTGYVGQGMIMGPRTTWSMLGGAILGYAILGPLARARGWAPGDIDDFEKGASGWILWVALAILLGESLTQITLLIITELNKSLLPPSPIPALEQRRSLLAQPDDADVIPLVAQTPTSSSVTFRGGSSRGNAAGAAAAAGVTGVEGEKGSSVAVHPRDENVPPVVWVSGFALSTVLCTVITVWVFGLPWYQPLVAILLAVLVAILAIRALGQTDLNPVSGVGKLSQLVFALVAPGKVVPNLVAGAIAEAGAMQAGDMMQDFKTAYLLDVSPVPQFVGMVLGSCASVGFSVVFYQLFTSVYEVGGEKLPAPAAGIWLNMARFVTGGALPPNIVPFAVALATVAAILVLFEAYVELLEKQHAKGQHQGAVSQWLAVCRGIKLGAPSGVGAAVGIYVKPLFTIPRVIGSVVEVVWGRMSPDTHQQLMLVVASGLVLGEGLAQIMAVTIKSFTGL